MKATCKKFKDGYVVFLESQDLSGGLFKVRQGLKKFQATSIVDELNWAFRQAEMRATKPFVDYYLR